MDKLSYVRRLTIVALSTPQTITLAALDICKMAGQLFVQTKETPCVLPLVARGIAFSTMDDLYIAAEDFDTLQSAIAGRLLMALEKGDVVYAVPGRGMDYALSLLRESAQARGVCVDMLYGVGYALAAAQYAGVSADAVCVAAAGALPKAPDTSAPLMVEELDTRRRAGEVKLALMEYYPDTHPVKLCRMQSDGTYHIDALALYELDRQRNFHATTVLLVPPAIDKERYGFLELVEIMHILRKRCPWDAKQTHQSLKKNMIEECYEAVDAIDKQDDAALVEELGDVLLQCVFHAEIAATQGRFNDRDMTTAIVKKLIYRHPHVFGSTNCGTAEQVLERWDELKKAEKPFASQSDALAAVPKVLPALMRAGKVQKRAAQVGFDWESAAGAFFKLNEEVLEAQAAMKGEGNIAEEIGDVLFAAVNVARLLGLEAEELLHSATTKFTGRFARMEAFAHDNGQNLGDLSLSEQNKLWNVVKSEEIGQ